MVCIWDTSVYILLPASAYLLPHLPVYWTIPHTETSLSLGFVAEGHRCLPFLLGMTPGDLLNRCEKDNNRHTKNWTVQESSNVKKQLMLP